jgi:FG-GAP-like repeat
MNKISSPVSLFFLAIVLFFLYTAASFAAVPTSDFDGDGKTDVSIYRPSNGQWWIRKSSDGSHYVLTFGVSTDRIVPADYTGDGKTDIAVWRPSSGEWFILRSEDLSYYSIPFGLSTDIPTPGDYDGDGKTDVAVFRPSTGVWYINRSLGGYEITTFGRAGDVPVNADYDGDGKSDISIHRSTEWWVRRSLDGGVYALPFSSSDPSSEVNLPGDYTGDNKADLSIFSTFDNYSWKYRRSEDGTINTETGFSGIPVPGDYDGDRRVDKAMFNPANGVWTIYNSGGSVFSIAFGTNGDRPTPNAFVR